MREEKARDSTSLVRVHHGTATNLVKRTGASAAVLVAPTAAVMVAEQVMWGGHAITNSLTNTWPIGATPHGWTSGDVRFDVIAGSVAAVVGYVGARKTYKSMRAHERSAVPNLGE